MNTKKVVYFAIGPIGAAALSLVTLPLMTWFFSVEDVGRLTMLQVTLGLSVSLFSFGMHQAYVREYHEVNDKPGLLKATVFPGVVALVAVVFISLVLPYSLSTALFDIASPKLTAFLYICITSVFLINFLSHVIRMQERGLAFSLTQILPRLALLAFVTVIIVAGQENNFKNLMLMNTLALAMSLTLFLWITRLSWLPAIKRELDVTLMRKMLLFSLPLVAGSLAYWALTTMDRFFLRMYSGLEELGVYAVSATLAGGVGIFSTIFGNLWHPTVYKWAKNGVDPKRIHRVSEYTAVFVAFIWTTTGIGAWIIGYFLPEEYRAVKYLIVASVSMPLFYLLSETTVVGIGITRKTSFAILAPIGAGTVNFAANYILIPKYGASGAALATLIAFFSFFVIRTEVSAFVWFPFPRIKLYFMSVLYLLSTIAMVLSEAKFPVFKLVWVLLLVTTLIIFFERVSEAFDLAKSYIKSY